MKDTKNIKQKLNELRLLKTDVIHHFEYSKTARIPFKIHSFIEIMNYRMIDFSEAIDLLIERNHIIPSLPLIRSLFENIAVTYRILNSVDKSIESNKLVENFDEIITKISFGTRDESDVVAINILTQLDKLDKEYNGIRKFYDSLSEFVHPNWNGVEGSYSELNEKNKETNVFKVITKDDKIYPWIESLFFLCMNIYIDFSKNIKRNLPVFSKLCETEIKNKK